MPIIEDPEAHEVAALARVVPSFTGLHVLEIGCGAGRLTGRYAQATTSVVAIDPNAESIATLRAEQPSVDARAMGIEDLVLTPHSIDVAIFSWSL